MLAERAGLPVPDGIFWDGPGDTEVVLARKRAEQTRLSPQQRGS
jgi:hypothetical protein